MAAIYAVFFGVVAIVANAELFWPQYGLPVPAAYNDVYNELPVEEELLPEENFPFQEVENEKESEGVFIPTKIGQASGVGVNSQNQLVIFHRAGRVWDQNTFDAENVLNKSLKASDNATITILNPETGDVIGEHGKGLFYMPHGLTVDSDDNVWLTDVGSHQIFKLDKNLKPILSLGEKLVPGSDSAHFCKPTDVAVAKSGEFFVADGYCNSRVMKFDKEGNYMGSFGHQNSGISAKNGEFWVPHSLTLIEDMNLICVADRDNQRVQCFTAGLVPKGAHQRAFIPMGTFVTKAENVGRIMALREKNHFLVGVTNTEPELSNNYDLFIMDINNGKVNTFAKGIQDAHGLAISAAGDIYVSQLGPQEVAKFSLPQPQNTQ